MVASACCVRRYSGQLSWSADEVFGGGFASLMREVREPWVLWPIGGVEALMVGDVLRCHILAWRCRCPT